MQKRDNLAAKCGKYRHLVTAMLTVSLIFNTAALLVPFSTMGNLFSKTVYVSLPYSVYLMWIESFYAIAILIFGFSIVFPFIKLYYLFKVWLFQECSTRRHNILRVVEPLGKWSMLDVFATCIILILCNNQILIYGTPMIGVDFFLAAIFLSIISSIIIDCLQNKVDIPPSEANSNNFSNSGIFEKKWYKISVVISLTIALIVLIFAIFFPYLQISSLLLIGYSYSIFSSATSLASLSVVLSAFMFLTMIIVPIVHTTCLLVLWCNKLRNRSMPRFHRIIKVLSRFNMLDVFMLAFVIFLKEGKSKINVEHRSGLLLIGCFIFIIMIVPQIISTINKIYGKRRID